MSVIHIETLPVAKGQYEFIQTWLSQDKCIDERTYTENHADRMIAAMTNLGYACRWFADTQTDRGVIVIVSDTDGKDVRFSGEHNELFKAIHSKIDYLDNRSKYHLIYGRYVGFLDRIRDLADEHEICFTQNSDALEGINDKGAEFVKGNKIPVHGKSDYWTRSNLLKLDLSGTANTVTYNACRKSIRYYQTDQFKTFQLVTGAAGLES